MISRRAWLAGAASMAALALGSRRALATGRIPYGGRMTFHVPWPLWAIDPHRVDDAAAAVFAESLFEPLYGPGDGGGVVPVLAAEDPQPDGATLRVPIRPGLRFASGAPLDARVAAASLARARARDASAWLVEIPVPR